MRKLMERERKEGRQLKESVSIPNFVFGRSESSSLSALSFFICFFSFSNFSINSSAFAV